MLYPNGMKILMFQRLLLHSKTSRSFIKPTAGLACKLTNSTAGARDELGCYIHIWVVLQIRIPF